jgi:hypothetical protein
MQESPFGFSYSWADLQPIRALVTTVVVAQVIGGLLGLFLLRHDSHFMQLWIGAAILTFPAFLVGLKIQTRIRPGSIAENWTMVKRCGLVALCLSVVAGVIV